MNNQYHADLISSAKQNRKIHRKYAIQFLNGAIKWRQIRSQMVANCRANHAWAMQEAREFRTAGDRGQHIAGLLNYAASKRQQLANAKWEWGAVCAHKE